MKTLIEKADEALDIVYHYGRSTEGSFGYEALKQGVTDFVEAFKRGERDLEQISNILHEGWGKIAKTFDDPVYQTKPEKQIKRLQLASTSYFDLPDEEKEKDRVMARALIKEVLEKEI